MSFLFTLFLFLFCSDTQAEEIKPTWDGRHDVFVNISDVLIEKERGTSESLNAMVASRAILHRASIKNHLNRLVAPSSWYGKINVMSINNIHNFYKNCAELNALQCAKKNKAWIINTRVNVGQKFSTLSLEMLNDEDRIIAASEITIWGKVRYKPQWKLTIIDQKSNWEAKKTKIYEKYPPKIEELPPLITPYHIGQAVLRLYTGLSK